ncbi:MAG: cytochrome c [Pseudomonadota bacterium]
MKALKQAMAGVLAIGVSGVAVADQHEDAIKYRQAAFTLIKGNFGPMGAMVKGEMPYDSEAFAEYAANVAAVAGMADDGFIDGSDTGDTKAKPEVWENRAEFDKRMREFQKLSGELAVVAKSGDMDQIKPKFGAVGKSCKACHDDFKSK